MPALFELDNVSVVRDGNRILSEVSLRIDEGQHTAILGPNGSGKSTLVRLLTREIYPYAGIGAVRVWGQERWITRDLRKLLGLVSPTPGEKILGEPTVLDMAVSGLLGTFGVLWGYEVTDAMQAHARAALEHVHLAHMAHRRFETLSAGESRRTLIARALVSEPKGLLLDEPTTSLDISSAREFRGIMRQVAQRGTTLILVTHHLEEIIPEISQVVLLKAGRIFAQGPRERVLTVPNLAAVFEMNEEELLEELDRTGLLR